MRNLSDLYPFPNTLVSLLVTGAEVADWLERAASVFRQIAPGSLDVPLRDDAVPSFVFETIPQLSYAIDLSKPARFDSQGRLVDPAARRVVGLRYQNRPILAADEFLLVTNSHRVGRARLHDPGAEPQVVFTDGARVQSIFTSYIQRKGVVGAAPQRNWHFLPMPGTSVRIAAGDGAEKHLSDIAGYHPSVIGRDPEGFTHYRLHL
jgi:2',3'-cyclic-nucleotide 2'-phosphodiesterase/3'-nucleotidase